MTYASKAPFDAGHRAGFREANVARVLGLRFAPPRRVPARKRRLLFGCMKMTQTQRAALRKGRYPHSCGHEKRRALWTRHLIDVTHEPCWIRTSDPLLKRQMLYQLS